MSAASGPLLVETVGAVRVLTLNRPEKLNALNGALSEALLQELRAAGTDPDVGAIVLTGAGRAFCVGADTTEFAGLTADAPDAVRERAALTTELHRVFAQLPQPVVAAVRGYALGGGCGLALAADLVIAADDARFGYPEIRHGIVAAVVMANLVAQLGRKAAFELVALGEQIPAERAQALGMVNRVVPSAPSAPSAPSDTLLDEAIAVAERLAALDRTAMAATKRLFYRVADLSLDQGLDAGLDANVIMRSYPGRRP
jgi:enoyl-CoA hydratase/carnithine racemase